MRNAIAIAAAIALAAGAAQAETRVIIPGPGTPVPDAERSGSGVAVIHAGEALLFDAAKGVDVLVHEVISGPGCGELPPQWQIYHRSSHTLTSELAGIASQTQPGVLVLTPVLHYGAPIETARTEVETLYDGKVVLADDLDEF